MGFNANQSSLELITLFNTKLTLEMGTERNLSSISICLVYSRGKREADWWVDPGYSVPASFCSWICRKVSYMSHRRRYPET
ncbi:hypothetical protein AYI69_g5875 [Smittium culicis]|uniref:Uncharacterized protein n=1 Tax=Smittium culicis TaxID=133412 RepID=A0A1R1Y381_9FUNG|nr:hypothetical protein AYI69_g5875 [Smittium culicis]